MAANPLFTGTLNKCKQPPLNNHTSNVLRQTNLNAGSGVATDTSVILRKKPRFRASDTTATMNDSDVWNDEMIVDDEMLKACDLMESQATQSSSIQRQTRTHQNNVEKKCDGQFVSGNVNNNVAQKLHSTPPKAAGTSASSSAQQRFSFKISQNTRSTSSNSQPCTKQSNMTYPTCQNYKVYYQPVSPTLPGGGTPQKTNSQTRSRNSSGTNSQPRSKNNSLTSKTPIKLAETPKNIQSSHSHKIQSNVALPQTSSTQPKKAQNHAHFKSSVTSAAAAKNSLTVGAAVGQQQSHSNPANRKQQQSTRPISHLTPPAGTTATRESPDLPTSTQEGESSQRPSLYQQQLEKYRLECENYKHQLKQIKDDRYSKDGEIKVLRLNLAKAKSEVSKLLVDKVQMEEKLKTHQGAKEKELAKEVEQLNTQLQFKNVDLREAQDSYRCLEQRLKTSDTTSPFPAPSQVTPPRRSLRVAQGSSPKVDGSPKGGDIFPTQESFMENNFSGSKRSPKISSRLRSEGQRSSPRRMPTLSSPVKVVAEPPPSQTFTPGLGSVGGMPKKRLACFPTAALLCTRLQQGQSTGTQLLGKLLEAPKRPASVTVDSESCGVGLLALFNKDTTLNCVPTTSERNSGRLSPTQASKTPNTKSPIATRLPQPTINENEDIALRALQVILNPPHTNTSSNVNHSHLNDNTTDSLLGLLPLIEERLDRYLEAVHNLTAACDRASSANPSSTFSRSSSVECSGDSLSSSGSEDNWVFFNLEKSALSCLQTLSQVVCHSDAVCRFLLSSGGVVKEERSDDEDISIMEIDPSAPLIDPTQAPVTKQVDSVKATSPTTAHCQSKIQLLSKLIRLASVPQPQQSAGITAGSVIEWTLFILSSLAKKSQIQELDRLRLLLINDSLSVHLTTDSSLEKTCCTLDIMKAMSRSYELLKRFCNQSDDCQLLHVYQCGLRGLKGSPELETTFITSKVIGLLLNIVNSHSSGATFLLETDCQCSMEVIEAVLLMLNRENRIYSQCKHTNSFSILRHGVMLLHSLMTCSDHKLDIEYIQLVICLTRLFRRHPETEAEANLLLDLWDFEEDDDEELQQDMEVQHDMEVDS